MINSVYRLPEIDFVGGSTEELVFNVYIERAGKQPFGLTGCTANFSVIDYVNKTGTPLVSKAMSIRINDAATDYNVLYVELKPEDTVDLFGKFIYQVSIKDVDSNIDIPYQGVIYIHNNINKDFVRA